MGAWQTLVAIAGLFGFSFGAKYNCYTIRNQCGKALYVAFGYPTTITDRYWETRGWWVIDGGQARKSCLSTSSLLYAYLDFAGSTVGDYHSDVTFALGHDETLCISQRRSRIWMAFGEHFTDKLTGHSANSCTELGIGATLRRFEMIDDGNYGSANVRHCPTWQGSNATPVAPVLEVSHQPLDPNSTDLEQVINATHPFAVLAYHPGKGWTVEEPQSGPDQNDQESEEPLLP
eukprot:Skav220633  [mRNA]  locus=scaffold112:433779:434474:- [translate_table: standard]